MAWMAGAHALLARARGGAARGPRGAAALEERGLPRAFIDRCRQRRFRLKVADSTGAALPGGALLARVLVLRRVLLRHFSPEERRVGVLLPPSAAAFATNLALALDGRVAVNLNYALAEAQVQHAIDAAGLTHVVTSHRVLERVELRPRAALLYLEDIAAGVGWLDRAVAAVLAYLVPAGLLTRLVRIGAPHPDDVLTVIFTAGTTGEPKGVVLTHRNVAANIQAIDQIAHITPRDVLVGILPFFHAYGYTGTLWTVATLDVAGVYHTNPLESQAIGRLCRRWGGTILMATPTFLRGYIARCAPDDFATLDVVVTGAEPLPAAVADAFERRFGIRPVEGYGATELAPLASVNLPPSRRRSDAAAGAREGSAGLPVPGVEVRAVALDTGEALPVDGEGMLEVRGPNVMAGYLDRPDLTQEVMHDGWYVTGDVGRIDADGFVHITGRLTRMSKIGGEMVGHAHVETALSAELPESDAPRVAVTAVPDERKGERLVVLYAGPDVHPAGLRAAAARAGLPPLAMPAPNSFYEVPEIPVLATGKLDLQAVRRLAAERVADGAVPTGGG